jgi:hypothetical protein
MKQTLGLLVAGSLALGSVTLIANQNDRQFDQLVTPDAIFGSGNANGSFTTDRHKGVEVALRAKTRFPVALNVFNSNGDGTYSFPAGDACPGFGFAPFPLCLATPVWNFEWSVNTDFDGSTANVLNEFIYQIGMDADPSRKTAFTMFDPITPSLVAPAWDHSIGTNATPNGGGVESLPNYVANLGTNNVAQNSWNYEFFNNVGTSLASFNPAVDGNYVIFLRAIDPVKKKVVAETVIQVLVGNAQKVKGHIKLPYIWRGHDDDEDDD